MPRCLLQSLPRPLFKDLRVLWPNSLPAVGFCAEAQVPFCSSTEFGATSPIVFMVGARPRPRCYRPVVSSENISTSCFRFSCQGTETRAHGRVQLVTRVEPQLRSDTMLSRDGIAGKSRYIVRLPVVVRGGGGESVVRWWYREARVDWRKSEATKRLDLSGFRGGCSNRESSYPTRWMSSIEVTTATTGAADRERL